MIKRIFEIAAALALGAMLLMTACFAVSRYLLAFVPVWAEPVMTSLVLLSVALAVGPGLTEGVHVAIHFGTDRLTEERRGFVARVVTWLTLGLGLAFLLSGVFYTSELWSLGVSDYAGIPQWIPAALGSVFGTSLIIFSIIRLRR